MLATGTANRLQATLEEPSDLQERTKNLTLDFATELRDKWIAGLVDEKNWLFIDFESYWDDECTLRKLANYAYVAHPDFCIHGVTIARGREPSRIIWGHQESLDAIRAEIEANPDTVIIAQNCPFDGTVLSMNGVTAEHYIDLTGMSRAWFKQELFHNLDAIAKRLFPHDETKRKVEDVLDATKYARTLNETLRTAMTPYMHKDTDLLRDCFLELLNQGFPHAELAVLDLTLQFSIVPGFEADIPLLQQTRDDSKKAQEEAMETALEYIMKNFDRTKLNSMFFTCANDRDTTIWKTKKSFNEDYRTEFGMPPLDKKEDVRKLLSSNDKFAYLLEHGFAVTVPMKESPTAKKRGEFELIPALGVNDVEFQELMTKRRDLKVIWEGRIAAKSNQDYTRAVNLLAVADAFDGKLIMPIRYSAAHTDRFGGMDDINVQNFRRASNHRKSLKAPEGLFVHVRDSSNIELRMSAAFCEHYEKLALFESGGDPYLTMADRIFGYTCNKKEHPTERGVGKATELGAGYGMGDERFRSYLNGGPLGMPPIYLEDIEGLNTYADPYKYIIDAYRDLNWPIRAMWKKLMDVVLDMSYETTNYQFGPLRISYQKMTGPNGLSIYYKDLHYANKQWGYASATEWTKLFGGKVLENIIQFLSRIAICEAMVMVHAMARYMGGRTVLQVHDEIVSLMWWSIRDEWDGFVEKVMKNRLSWLPACPLASEADAFGFTYS